MAVEFAMLHDVAKCTACRGCSVACKQWKHLPAEPTPFDGEYQSRMDLTSNTYTIVRMKEVMENDKVRWDFLKYQCMHCGKPDCMKVCPVDAIEKNENGIVIVDEEICIGCGSCEYSCVFGVPHVHSKDKKSRKCNMCIDRLEKYIENGFSKKYLPACAKTCTSEAIYFGTRDEMVSLAEKKVEELKIKYPDACTYNVRTDTKRAGGSMIYVLPYAPSVYGLPDEEEITDGDTGDSGDSGDSDSSSGATMRISIYGM